MYFILDHKTINATMTRTNVDSFYGMVILVFVKLLSGTFDSSLSPIHVFSFESVQILQPFWDIHFFIANFDNFENLRFKMTMFKAFFSDTVTWSKYKKKSKQPVLQNVQHELVSMLLKYLNAQQGLLLQTELMETKLKWDVQIYLNLVPSCDAVTSVLNSC